MAEVDLHLHTTFSDGTLSPTQVVKLCASRGLRVIAITDHDSTEGIEEALRAAGGFPELTVIPGIELSTEAPRNEIHVLGYFVDSHHPELQQALKLMRDSRKNRAKKMIEKLDKLGVKISWERVQELSGGRTIGRPHIAQAMVERGYIQYPRQAFEGYLARNDPAYVERMKITPVEAVEILVRNGALPVMAHPIYWEGSPGTEEVTSLKMTLSQLKEVGLVGMEVYYGDCSPQQVECLAEIAGEFGLIPCGGSDFHGSGNPNEPEPGSAGPPMDTVEALRSLWRCHRSADK